MISSKDSAAQNGARHHEGAAENFNTNRRRISQEWTQKFSTQDNCTINFGLNTIEGGSSTAHTTKCELPTAVHIAQLSSSDEDYLDFEEAEDFEMEDEAT